MYKKGDAKLLINRAAMSGEEEDEHWEICLGGCCVHAEGSTARKVAALPRSCNQWVIGGPVEISRLIDDLMALLLEFDGKDRVLPEE